MNYRDSVFVVNVIDQGKGIKTPLEIFKKKDIDKKIENRQRPRGIGLFLIKHLVDQLEFNQITDRGHGVRMIFENKESIQLLNTAIIKTKERKIDSSYEDRLHKACSTPAIEARDNAR